MEGARPGATEAGLPLALDDEAIVVPLVWDSSELTKADNEESDAKAAETPVALVQSEVE